MSSVNLGSPWLESVKTLKTYYHHGKGQSNVGIKQMSFGTTFEMEYKRTATF